MILFGWKRSVKEGNRLKLITISKKVDTQKSKGVHGVTLWEFPELDLKMWALILGVPLDHRH